jgi:hypothetical protein
MARADSKAVVGLHANGFASVPQDRRRAPRSLNTASEGLSSLAALGFPKPDLVKVTLVEWLFCDVAESRAKKYAEFVHRR